MKRQRFQTLSLAALLVVLGASTASAQAPVEAGVSVPPLALILMDTSGSMDYTTTGGDGTTPVCVNDGAADWGSNTTRMHTAIEVLTGEVIGRYCALDRRNTVPNRIDQLFGDRGQGINHHRLCSRRGAVANHALDCVPASPWAAFNGLQQLNNGLIDEFGDKIAFGLMSFDSFDEAGSCEQDMWSYGPSMRMNMGNNSTPQPPASPEMVPTCTPGTTGCWNIGAQSPYVNEPGAPNCTQASPLNVPQAYTIPPLDPTGTRSQGEINDLIQERIVRLLPYWGTPIGAQLADAYHFYEGGPDYFAFRGGTGSDYSHGIQDPYLNCRDRFVLLITDGVPSNADCVRTGTDGASTTQWSTACHYYPYADAPYYARQLRQAGIPVFVVGFSLANDPMAEVVLNEIAQAGGTGYARFAEDGMALIYEIADIFSTIASGTPSRTTPANGTQLSSSTDTRGSYTFETHFEIHGNSPYWTGEVSRVERVCEDGALSEPQVINFSEWYDALDIDDLRDYPILTTSPRWHSCYIRKNAAADYQSLFTAGRPNPLTQSYGVTPDEIIAACQANGLPGSSPNLASSCTLLASGDVGYMDTIPGGDWDDRCLAELTPATAAASPHLFGAIHKEQASMFANWLRGWSLTELRQYGGFGPEIDAYVPTMESRWDGSMGYYTNDRQSRLAAVVNSSPALVTVPDGRLDISAAYSDFVEETVDRPGVLYVATTDGLLRALNARTQEEIFAFLPSSVAHNIGKTMLGQHAVIDGSPVVQDVRTHRVAAGEERWMTVLLLPYRSAARGVVALDVTDPYNPAFLWELDAELDPQFGYAFSKPAMGTIFMERCLTDSTVSCERGVAIIGGGSPTTNMHGWETTNIGRTLYVVDLETGLVLNRFTHFQQNGVSVPITGPVTGEVAAYDGFAGSLISRAFVGTLDGKLLRLDLSASNPTDWFIDVMFDADELPDASGPTSGIFFRPTIALSGRGSRAVVVFGTGNLDNIEGLTNETNYVVSLTETPVFDGDGDLDRFEGDLNWALKLEAGEQLTARPRIFNRQAYFATFVQNDDDACAIGGARLYGLDYLGLPENKGYVGSISTTKFSSYLRRDPHGVADPNPLVGYHDQSNYLGDEDPLIPPSSIIHSINITERVSCFVDEELEGTRYGDQNVVRTTSEQGEFVLQVGASTYSGAAGAGGAVSQVGEIGLDRPASTVIPTSWSVIFE